MSFFVYAWIASIVYGLYAIVAKLVGVYQLKNVWQFAFFSMLFGSTVMSIIALANGGGWPTDWIWLGLASLFLALGSVMYLLALKNMDVSVLAPMFNIRVVITVLLGYFFLHEPLSADRIWLIGLVVLAGFFASMDERFLLKSFFDKNNLVGLLFMFVLSIQSTFINRAVEFNGYWTTMLWMGLLAAAMSFWFLYPKFRADLPKTPLKHYGGVLLLALFGGLGDLAAYRAFAGNIGISSVIISLPISMVLAFILSVFKPTLLEKHPAKVYMVRFLAAIIMIWGGLKLSL